MDNNLVMQQSTKKFSELHLLGSMQGTITHNMILSCPYLSAFSLYLLSNSSAQLKESRSIWNLASSNLILVHAGLAPLLKVTEAPLHFQQMIVEGPAPIKSSDGIAVISLTPHAVLPQVWDKLVSGVPQKEECFLLNQMAEMLKTETQLLLPDKSLPPASIQLLKQILDTRYAEKLTLDSLSKELHWNKYKLDKDFRFYYGCPPCKYLLNVRVTKACHLLCSTNRSVLDIGFAVGIENTSYFIRMFRKHTGMSPLTYRTHFSSLVKDIHKAQKAEEH